MNATGEPPRSAYYGLTEIAAALDLDRQLVTAWRRRGSHAIPEPDAELSSGPIWRGATIEPWIDTIRRARAGAGEIADLRPESALRLARRLLRLTALALEQPARASLVARAVADVRELLPALATAVGPLAERARALASTVEPALTTKTSPELATVLVASLASVAELVVEAGGDG